LYRICEAKKSNDATRERFLHHDEML